MRPTDARVRAQLAPARHRLAGVAAAGLAGGLLVIAQAWVVAGLVIAVLHHHDLAAWCVAVIAVLAARGLVGSVGDSIAASAASVVGTVLRHRLVRAAVAGRAGARPVATGEIAVLATRGVTAAEPYLTRYVPALVIAAVLPPLTVVAMATQDLLSAAIVMATLPLVPVFGALVGLATRDRAAEQWQAMTVLSGHFLDVVRGLPTLVAHRRARAQSSRIAEVTDRYRRAALRTLRIAFASSAVLELVATLSVALVAVTVGVRLASGSVGLHTALVVLLLAPEAYWPLRRVGAEFHAAAEGAATFAAAEEVLAEADGGAGSAAAANAPLVLEHVTVAYADRSTPAVRDVSTIVRAHGVTALTGPSGCGKSTLLAAMAGLLPVAEGAICSGGELVGGPAWQAQVAWLPQQPGFVAGSIADNLRLARPRASDSELWTALGEVALAERVRTLPDGLDSPLGEDGATLSAGERARLALARIVLADRPWVFLDEPSAHLDEITELVIADTIRSLGERSGVVVVAHRPRIIELADQRVDLPAADPLRVPPRRAAVGRRGVAPAAYRPEPEATTGRDSRILAGATVVGALASLSGVALTATAGWLIVQASTHPAVLTLLVAVVGVRAFGLARPVLRYAERLRAHDAALRMLARRRVEVYDALVPLVPGRTGRRGELLSAVVDDVDGVVDRELRVRMPVRQTMLVCVGAALVAALLQPLAGAVVATGSLIAGIGGWALAHHGARHAERRLLAVRSELSTQVVEAVQLADELLMWQRTDPVADRVAATSARIGEITARAARRTGAGRAWVLTASGAAMAATALVTAPALMAGALSAPVMALLVLLPLALADVLLPVADAGALAARTAAADERLRELEHTPPLVPERPESGAEHGATVTTCEVRARWDAEARLTEPVTLDLAAGDRVALIGPSGSGKSTVAALLLRFLDPADGTVLLGGEPMTDLPPDDVRRVVGLVDDHPHVFATTVAENVRLARPDASDTEVEAALRRARLGDWVDGLPDGLDTFVGEGHGSVSGGERARLGVARSLLADHPVLVLDEPTAHLDHPTAVALAHEVLAGEHHRSVLWITHGTAGVGLVDRVVELGARGGDGPRRDVGPGPETSHLITHRA